MKCTECGLYASPSAKFCEECGGDVKIDESIIKECPECSKKLKSTAKFCTGCRFSFENVTKKIICEGKREDDTKCNRELSPSDRICSRCGTRLRKEDDHEGGNDKNQPEELDGRDDEDRPEQKTEKQIIETIENTTQKPIFKGDEPEKRGLAVVCSHSEFIHKGHKLKYRDSALNDHDMMKSLWDLYDCHVIDFTDEGSNFYDTELIEKIDDELKTIGNPEFFVFVLSSHGEEKEEKLLRTDEQGSFQHYFFTNDGQCSTQDLMNEIANIKKLENKLKIFIIQACRSRIGATDENEEHGVEIEIVSEKSSDLSGGQNDGTVHPDAKPDDKRQNDGIDLPDARGYMPPEDEEVIQQPNVASGRTEAHGEMENKIENSTSEAMLDLPPVEGVPHVDDCVVMFASMSGKYAYSKVNSIHDSGGWLINSVDKILKKYENVVIISSFF